ncbi:MAG: metallophosphoesterase [Prevotella sp.]|nr:metallophosphoesterase [Prevotella sp.]
MQRLAIFIFLLLPILAQGYISWRTWQLLPAIPALRITVVALMALAFILFFVAMSGVINHWPMALATATYEIGTSWLIVLLYLFMIFLVLDILRLCHFVPVTAVRENGITTAVMAVGLTALFFFSWRHYEDKKRVEMTVKTEKAIGRPKKLVLVSDIHLGYHNTRGDLRRWLQLLKAEKPDAILIAGDLIDGSYRPVAETRMAEEFRRLGIPVYACLGNHDYYTGVSNDLLFCKEAGIHVLRDAYTDVDSITVIGRDDRTNLHRKPLSAVMKGVDHQRFFLELDHQPYHLEEAERNGVDFEFAGHTHHGQVWPLNWITDAVYEDAFGPLRKGHTQYYVSSGLGIWGAKFRIATQSEYIVLNIVGK